MTAALLRRLAIAATLVLAVASAQAMAVPAATAPDAGGREPAVRATAAPDPDAPLAFADAAEEARFRALAAELRCVMCQNQSLADSNAVIARDLRMQVLALMRDGLDDAQIKEYLVARYSDFVLYEPPVKPATWLLWFGPALILLGGAAVVVAIVRRRAAGAPAVPPRDDEQEW